MNIKLNNKVKKAGYIVFTIIYFAFFTAVVFVLNNSEMYKKSSEVVYNLESSDEMYAERKRAHLVGIQEIDGKKYYFDEKGSIKTGWINVSENERYYADGNGEIVTGKQTIADIKYEFDNDGRLLNEEENNVKMVALTFDDGPSEYTDEILDVLEKYNVKATFFLLGSRVYDYSKELKRAYDDGCQIGSHTYNHKYLTSLSLSQLKKEIDMTNDKIESIIGEKADCLRPPGGFYDHRVLAVIDCPIAMWSVDTLDWKSQNTQSVIKIATTDIKNGDIILMHDIYSSTAKAVEKIVPELIQQGFKLVTVSELLNANGGVFDKKIYYSAYKVQE